MSATNTANWIRAGLLALPIYGLLTFWATFTHEPDRQNQVEAYARYISTPAYLAQHLIGSILGTILAIFGFIALAAYLANGRAGRLALLAMVLSVAGNCLILTIFGFSTLVSPVIGRLYLEGQPGVMEVNEAILSSPAFIFVVFPGLLLFLVGSVLFGVAIWRSGTLPRWAGALWAAGAVFMYPLGIVYAVAILGVQSTPRTVLVGTLLLVVSGAWMALSVLRGPSAEKVGVQARPRVQ